MRAFQFAYNEIANLILNHSTWPQRETAFIFSTASMLSWHQNSVDDLWVKPTPTLHPWSVSWKPWFYALLRQMPPNLHNYTNMIVPSCMICMKDSKQVNSWLTAIWLIPIIISDYFWFWYWYTYYHWPPLILILLLTADGHVK